ncbi:hypothetical protein LTR37_014780 [Vermiconidia calcicola]|uniref:Uncharacterized protein n=1 Tax=Vermiconidia calcicola TaxID=1690605 RepID=A0ACC3MU50_9PEZI|nr:hypothetical protein LTR37_014780 [Vermiconidia calcicola]
MPPKKAANKAKSTPSKASAPAAEAPSTVTNSKGKEFETTAAAGRTRRAAAPDTPTKKAQAKKAASKTATTTSSAAGAKRGRPAKAAVDDAATEPPKKRGRPAKAAADDADETTTEPPKKRGRPAKEAADETTNEPPKKRGRPAKAAAAATKPAQKRGRPAKAAPAVPIDEEEAAPKKRGRPPRGGETTKAESDDQAAAEQLEDELDDVVDDADAPSKNTSLTVKRGRPAKGKGKQAATSTDAADEQEQDEGSTGTKFWLMKAEQVDRVETLENGDEYNAKFTIDDLRDKGGPEPWDGVRNPTACKNLKSMKPGDLAFFYASGGKGSKQPGIVGIMEVVGEPVPDLSALDENAAYYVKNPKMRGSVEKPRWFMVDVEFRKKLSKPVTREELQKFTAGEGVLSQMQEFTAARLSVSKVTESEWNFICTELIEWYEDDAELPNGAKKDDTAMEDADIDADADAALPNGAAVPEVQDTIESEPPTTDTLLPVETAATSSRPASRAGSRAASRAGSRAPSEKKPASRPASRAGSLVVPRATSRGRSRTPSARASSAAPMGTVAEEMDVINE